MPTTENDITSSSSFNELIDEDNPINLPLTAKYKKYVSCESFLSFIS